MSVSRLGLRYERLLFLAAPISIAALLVLFVAFATENQQELFESRCYTAAAEQIEKNRSLLNKEWERQISRITSRQGKDVDYELAVRRTWIFGLSAGSRCYYFMDAKRNMDLFTAPDTLVENLNKASKIEVVKPLKLYGVEIPEKASIGLFGTTIKVELLTLTQALQIGLAPLLLLWLGSLYNTRYRETLFVGAARSITDVFPHLINVYPVGKFLAIRKKSWIRYYWPNLIGLGFSLIRICLVTVFIGPSVVFYVSSLYFLHSTAYVGVFVVLGALVSLLALANILVELYPWHFKKTFPGDYAIG